WNEARRVHGARYDQLLGSDVTLLGERPESPCIYHLMPVRFPDRDRVAQALSAAGIETGVHYAPVMHQHAALLGCAVVHGETPVAAEAWAAEELSLPMHPDLRRSEIERVAEAVLAAIAPRAARSGRVGC
ncbi:MAG: DegT/DnrJ/EryC1/StrS family aminotransferase, partial [Solirubrobacteraceae bacterium]